jgi:heme oxygenase
MDHPLMKSIYNKSISTTTYASYLRSQHEIFVALEEACTKHAGHPFLKDVDEPMLLRASRLQHDLNFFNELNHGSSKGIQAVSPKTKEYLALLATEANDPALLLCHHFLQYNAVLSGGQYLKRCLSTMLASDGKSDGKQGLKFYEFDGLVSTKHSAYVQQYMKKMDALPLDDRRDAMVAAMQRVYTLSLAMMDEACPRGNDESDTPQSAVKRKRDTSWKLTLDQLHQFDGSGREQESGAVDGRIFLSIRGLVYDVSRSSENYGPEGSYQMFAGRDVTRCLSTMSLEQSDLDDVAFFPESKAHEMALARWEHRLGGMYDIVASMAGDDRHTRKIVSAAEVVTEILPAGASGTEGEDQACPFTGTKGGVCPITGIIASASDALGRMSASPKQESDAVSKTSSSENQVPASSGDSSGGEGGGEGRGGERRGGGGPRGAVGIPTYNHSHNPKNHTSQELPCTPAKEYFSARDVELSSSLDFFGRDTGTKTRRRSRSRAKRQCRQTGPYTHSI